MRVTIVSDASHCDRTHAAGYGFWAVSQRGHHAGGGAFKAPLHSPNTAEILAIVNALHVALSLGIAAKGDSVLVQTDSLAAIMTFEGRRRKIVDPDQKRAVEVFGTLTMTHALTVAFRHVKGHTKVADRRSQAQRHADARARAGMKKARAKAAA